MGEQGRPLLIHAPPNPDTYTKHFKNARFPTYRLVLMDGQTDGASYRVACPQLKIGEMGLKCGFEMWQRRLAEPDLHNAAVRLRLIQTA